MTPTSARTTRFPARVALAIGVVLVSTAGPFIHMAEMPAFAVVFWRMALAGPLFLLVAHALPRGHRPRVVVGALLLTAHFLLWVKAFDLTDFASNLILLVAQPIMGAALSRHLGEPSSRRMWVGVALAFVGLLIIAGGDVALGGRALLGDAMCVAAGIAITLFYVVTREARHAVALPAFMGWTFVFGAIAALPVVLISGVPLTGQAPWQGLWLLALVLVTTMAGHGLINLAARGVSLFALNFVIILEPAIAIGLGALLFGARVLPAQVLGGAVLSLAILVGLRAR